jgi:hypothetical protein
MPGVLTRSKTSMESSLCSTCSCFRLACSFSKESSAYKRRQRIVLTSPCLGQRGTQLQWT